MQHAWVILFVAGLLEVGWAVGLKFTDGLSMSRRPVATSTTLVAMIGSMYLLAVAVRSIPIGTGYAIWTGIGAVGAATLGMALFHEPVTLPRLICLAMVIVGLVGLKMTASTQLPSAAQSSTASTRLFVGTYSSRKGHGVYTLSLDPSTGTLGEPRLVAKLTNASFLAIHPTLPVLYAVSEVDECEGRRTGGVAAFRIGADGTLDEIAKQDTGGEAPCFVSVDVAGRWLLVANYNGGSVVAFRLDPQTGVPREATSIARHDGRGPNATRQARAHAHSIVADPSGHHAIAADLGTDELIIYKLDDSAGTISRVGATTVAPGSGPRHLAFSPDGHRVYVVNELSNTIVRYDWDAAVGTLTKRQTIGTLPYDAVGENAAAEIAVHPSGRFVYVSNRGDDSIAIFEVDPASGDLAVRGHVKTRGVSPRHFAIEPTGKWLVVANQKSDSLVLLRIDAVSGLLTQFGNIAEIGAPACVCFR